MHCLLNGQRPPEILQIHRDVLKPGSEASFKNLEEDAARICADLNCPHPHMAIESLTGEKEVWWLNVFESEAHKQSVTEEYTSNRPLMAALESIRLRRENVLRSQVDIFAHYRADLSRGTPWTLAGVRFFVVTVTNARPLVEGSVFEAPDGSCFVFRALGVREHADLAAAAVGREATVFAVRPYWGMPSKDWVAADPEFWRVNPGCS